MEQRLLFMNSKQNKVMYDLEPSEFYLSQNYPNPFIEKTTIKYCVAYKTKVRLEVFDNEGKMIKVLVDEEKEAGTYEIELNASVFNSLLAPERDNGSSNSLEGIYICQLQAKDFLSTKRMILLR
jgi:hypothetical protein